MLQLGGESWVLGKWSGGLLMMGTKVRKEKEVQTNDRGELSQTLPSRSPEGSTHVCVLPP